MTTHTEHPRSPTLDILFDGPPSHPAGRFVEVESTETGCGVSLGEWIERPDGYWVLRIPDPAFLLSINADLLEALKVLADHAEERYPRFKSPRGQREIAQAKTVIAKAKP